MLSLAKGPFLLLETLSFVTSRLASPGHSKTLPHFVPPVCVQEPLHSLLPISIPQGRSPTAPHPNAQSESSYRVNGQCVPVNEQRHGLHAHHNYAFLSLVQNRALLQEGHASGKHLAGELDRRWKEIWCLLFTMRLKLERKYAAAAYWLGGDGARTPHAVSTPPPPPCAAQATGGSDRLETADLGASSPLDHSLKRALCYCSL